MLACSYLDLIANSLPKLNNQQLNVKKRHTFNAAFIKFIHLLYICIKTPKPTLICLYILARGDASDTLHSAQYSVVIRIPYHLIRTVNSPAVSLLVKIKINNNNSNSI